MPQRDKLAVAGVVRPINCTPWWGSRVGIYCRRFFEDPGKIPENITSFCRYRFASAAAMPSQLKQLKASLRDNGIIGPQKSKKQKRQGALSGADRERKIARSVALEGIREQFNPFEAKVAARRKKFQSANAGELDSAAIVGRPGITKGLGEEAVCNPSFQRQLQ